MSLMACSSHMCSIWSQKSQGCCDRAKRASMVRVPFLLIGGSFNRMHDISDAALAFRSIFPAGTVSGAPKVRAMELIAELEREKRGVYAGAVGYFGYGSF